MELQKVDHEILIVEQVQGKEKVHTVKKHYCHYYQLHASFDQATDKLTVEMREPIIEGTEWQGELIQENRTVPVFIDGEEAGTMEIVNGVGSVILDMAPGTYLITVGSGWEQPAEIEVTVE